MSKYILELKSVQSGNIKTLFEVIKEVLYSDINIIFTRDYIKIVEMDSNDSCMIHLELKTSAFEYYRCEEKIVVGINANNFFKIIKTSKKDDTISFFIEEENQSVFIIKLENSSNSKVFESFINRMDITERCLDIPPLEYTSPIVTPSVDFQKICKDMNSLGLSNSIKITNVGQKIIFTYVGEFSTQKISIGNNSNNNNINIAQGFFNLKFLLLFSKATSLSTTVNIYIENDSPLVLEYHVGNLGKLSFILNEFEEV